MNNQKQIAVIGPTQSGKTCLAVGLFSTSTTRFTITTPNKDDQNYLVDRRRSIVSGIWPDANNKNPIPLRFDFHRKGKEDITVVFSDYAGELHANTVEFKEFANRNFRNLSGVILLINPGADAFQSGDSKLLENIKAQYAGILDFIHDPHNGSADAFIALTVTASDRIHGPNADLKGREAAFKDCLEGIENSLSSMGFRWKKFFVSMSGPTAAGNKYNQKSVPKRFPNTSSKPFLWILDKLSPPLIPPGCLCRSAWFLGALIVIAIVGCMMRASKDLEYIQTSENNARKELDDPGSTANAYKKAFDNASRHIKELKDYKGTFHKEKARKIYKDLKPDVWEIFNKGITRSIEDLSEDARQNPTECDGRIEKIDAYISSFLEVYECKDECNVCSNEYVKLKEVWKKKKTPIKENILIGGIKTPLIDNVGKHGDSVLRDLIKLNLKLDKIKSTEGDSSGYVQRWKRTALKLDERVYEEFSDYEIPDFDKMASTNATENGVRSLSEKLKDWNPATTNGAAYKGELLAVVSNSIPKWRTSYEENRIRTLAAEAVKSCDMAKMARLFPSEVNTNMYLTASFIESVWTNIVEVPFEKARRMFINEVIGKVEKRSGRPELTKADEEKIMGEVNRVGSPLDNKLLHEIKQVVKKKALEWDESKRGECEEWVRANVKSDRKRTGRNPNGLWDEYKSYWRKYRADNPFVESIVRCAVYKQIEEWFDSDIEEMEKKSKNLPDAKKNIENVFHEFRTLCRRVSEDREPLKTSWAWHFACECVNSNKLESISSCFPQKLSVTSVKGKIDYNDFRIGYKGTDLCVTVSSESIEGETKKYNLSNETFVKDDNKKEKECRIITPLSLPFHPFDIVKIELSAEDRVPTRHLKCPVDSKIWSGFMLGKEKSVSLIEIGGKFDLKKQSMWPLTTKDTTPDAYIYLEVTIEGDSIDDCKTKAKKCADEERSREQGN